MAVCWVVPIFTGNAVRREYFFGIVFGWNNTNCRRLTVQHDGLGTQNRVLSGVFACSVLNVLGFLPADDALLSMPLTPIRSRRGEEVALLDT